MGHPVKLDIVSDASSPAQVVTNYQKLISSDHDQLVFGPFSTLLTVPSSKVVNRYGYAFVEGAGGAPAAFGNGLKNIFDVSLPVIDNLIPFAHWLATLPASQRPKTAAVATSDDPFTQPQFPAAVKILQNAGIKIVYNKVFPAEVTDYTPIATAVASTKAEAFLLGSVDVPTVSAFIHTFIQQHYNPKAFIATAGPDQGAAFLKAIGGASNAEGVMVPNGWYPGYAERRQPEDGQRVRRQVRRHPLRRERRRRRGVLGGPDRRPGGRRHAQPRQLEDHRLPAQRSDPEQRPGPGEVRLAR